MLDPEYLRLYRRYAKAIRAYDNALKKRREVRARWHERRKSPAPPRRPVGSPHGFTIPRTATSKVAPTPAPQEMSVYLGKILGWAKLVGTSPPLPDAADPTAEFDVDAVYDRIQLQLYWNAKNHYEKCKRDFFDYVRRGPNIKGGKRPTRGYRKNLARAKEHTQYAANLQLLGCDDPAVAEAALENARREVENALYKLWDNYRSDPKNKEVIKDLIGGLIEGQLHGLNHSSIARVVQDEVNRLVASGAVK